MYVHLLRAGQFHLLFVIGHVLLLLLQHHLVSSLPIFDEFGVQFLYYALQVSVFGELDFVYQHAMLNIVEVQVF